MFMPVDHPGIQGATLEKLAAAMREGKAPIGTDGFPTEIHHKTPLAEGGKNNEDNFQMMTQAEHRRGDNYKKNHPNLP